MGRPRKIRHEEQFGVPQKYDETPTPLTPRHSYTYTVTDENLLSPDMKEEGAIDEYLQSCFELGGMPVLAGVMIGEKSNG